MTCEFCELHKLYLERIIKIQNEELNYFKNLYSQKSNYNERSHMKSADEITNSIFDIIDFNIEQLDVNLFLEKIEYKYPAGDTITQIIESIITHSEYVLMYKEKSNIIKYLDKDNKIIYKNIETFSFDICDYIFNLLKPIIQNVLVETVEDDNEIKKENNRVQNIMLLKDKSFTLNMINKIIHRLK